MAKGGHRECGLHPRVARIAHDPVGIDVFDVAQLELAFTGGMLGDVGQPHIVGALSAELAADEVVLDWRPRSTIQSPLFGEDRPDALPGAQPCNAVLAGSAPASGQFVSDEQVAEGRIIGMDAAGGVDQVRIVPITLRQRRFPLVAERLSGITKVPAGHRDGQP